ncbi:integrase catalytic domain-containing protein [Roseateles sp. DB2]|uniref:integrase catalytic domain-containing protein n=1 Tax=Roseateles sp. DB2 TaxID=3453717 RepID=UPI003EEEA431
MTRHPRTISVSNLLKQIWQGDIQIIQAGVPINTDSIGVREESPLPAIAADQLSKAESNSIARKVAYVTAVEKAHLTRGMRKAIARLVAKVAERIGDSKAPSASTVMEWMKKRYQASGSPLALLDRRGRRQMPSKLHPKLDALLSKSIRTVYLTRSQHSMRLTQTKVHAEADKLVREGGLPKEQSRVSLSTISRRIAEVDHHRVVEARLGPSRARLLSRVAMDGTTARYPLDVVEVDHTPLNWVVVCDRTGLPLGRPTLTVAIDAYSGYVLGLYVSFYGPGLTSVSGAMRFAIRPKDDLIKGIKLEKPWLAMGVPDLIKVDNGLEFHSPMFQRIGWQLGSHFTYCRVRTPWIKPHVERFFGGLDQLTLTRGKVHKRVANVLNLDPVKDAAITFSALVQGLIMFCVDYYPFQINERKLARPFDLFEEGLQSTPAVAFPDDLEALRRISALSTQLTLNQGGITLRGLPYGGAEQLPARMRREKVRTWVKWDPDDLSQIWFEDPATKQWIASPCRWHDYAAGLSWNQHLLIRRFARQEFKKQDALEYLERARLRLHEHWLEAACHRKGPDRKLAAQISGLTSSRVLEPSESKEPPLPVPVSEEQVKAMPAFDPADFEMVEW